MRPTRPTLEKMLAEQVQMKPYEFARAIGVTKDVVQKWHLNKPLLLKLVISGYKKEVLGK